MITAVVLWVEVPVGGWLLELPGSPAGKGTCIPLHRGRATTAESLLDGVRQVLAWLRHYEARPDVAPQIPIMMAGRVVGSIDLAAGAAWFSA